MRKLVLAGAAAMVSGVFASVVLVDAQSKPSSPVSQISFGAQLAGQWHLSRDADPTALPMPSALPPGGPMASAGGMGLGNYARGPMPESLLRERAMFREANQPPDVLTIAVSKETITFTHGDGVVRKYSANGKKEKVDLTTAIVETTTAWQQDTLNQEMKSGAVRMSRTWQAEPDGNRLVVTIETRMNPRVKPYTRKFVYERAPSGGSTR